MYSKNCLLERISRFFIYTAFGYLFEQFKALLINKEEMKIYDTVYHDTYIVFSCPFVS